MSELRLDGLPLVPSDNRLYRHGFNTYASSEYSSWLEIVRPLLLEALGDSYTPDTEAWWGVTIRLRMNHGDGPNRQKGILDWLSGRYPLAHAATVAGKKRQKGALVNGLGLWNDDARVRYVLPFVESIRCGEPSCDVWVRRVSPPVDEREKARQTAQESRQQARATLQAERAAAKARETQERARIRLEARAGRQALAAAGKGARARVPQ